MRRYFGNQSEIRFSIRLIHSPPCSIIALPSGLLPVRQQQTWSAENNMKTYTITENGEVVELSPFSPALIRMPAKTKAEATKQLLADYLHQRENPPALYVRNGAYLLITAEPNGRFQAESGALNRADSKTGRLYSLCSSSHASFRDATNDISFGYYASEDFQSQNA